METKSSKEWMDKVKEEFNMKQSWVVPSNGRSGGLALLWKDEIKIELLTYSLNHIDVLVSGGSSLGGWHLTGFYGNPEIARRSEFWAKLKHLKGVAARPWLAIRDFNELTSLSEKEGGGGRPRQQMDNFVEANFCDLRDIGFVGPKLTWIYQRADGTQIRERLDQTLATSEWLDLFAAAKLYHKSTSASDHSMLLFRMVAGSKRKRVKRSLRFESMWLRELSCEEVVRSALDEGLATSLASSRQKKNLIGGLLDSNGVWQEEDGKIEEVVVEYHNNLFTSSNPTNFSELLHAIQPKVTHSMNQMLIKPFIEDEVRLALKQMYPLKAPSLDGMPPLFF
ncbi:uncharacterized protein LOC142639649 [Castanea sativa]|uniref:uncharacterized protein LOC142639649 n=1 Tax=Castanea sativa TaxID=21020 RepID=UPI003F64E927